KGDAPRSCQRIDQRFPTQVKNAYQTVSQPETEGYLLAGHSCGIMAYFDMWGCQYGEKETL
ncbi:MAG: hypothetical protein MUQ10_15030, partial [Anaerolineae bacterium]|nr:hypothetical protein [Anaerolineae bacterium]